MRGLYRRAVLRVFQRMRQAMQGGRVLCHHQHEREREATQPSLHRMAPRTWRLAWLVHRRAKYKGAAAAARQAAAGAVGAKRRLVRHHERQAVSRAAWNNRARRVFSING